MAKKYPEILIGAHMPTNKGPASGIVSGNAIGCTAVQIFTKNNRQWNAKPLTKEVVDAFKDARATTNMGPIAAHATYLINLASPNKETLEKSVKGLELELKRCDELGIEFLVLHPGSHLKSSTLEAGIAQIADSINTVLADVKPKCTLLIETMAGQGTNIGYRFEQLAEIINNVRAKKHIGVCMDTCHMFAAGYEFDTPVRYKKLMDQFDEIVGLKYLKAMHINNSKTMCGSRKDRHEHLTKGQIPLSAFKLIVNDPQLAHVPKYLETPLDTIEDHKKNLTILAQLLNDTNAKKAKKGSLGQLFDKKESPDK